jgi:inulin fructotransferase (DFA-I-forming)
MANTVYDVTTFAASISATDDIGRVINEIIADIKTKQPSQASKPGAVIYIPPGDYSLKTRVTIDISYLQIKGSGHGFTSSSIRYNSDTTGWSEIWPGGSRVRVENTDGNSEAFLIARAAAPRLSSIEFSDFCLDGVAFTSGGQNSYQSGKIGIRSTTATDSLRITGMGMVYLGRAILLSNPDAAEISGNFLCENASCVELVDGGQASLVTGNLIGAGFTGFSIYAENFFGLLVTGNNVFPRGKSMVHLKNSNNCSVSANRFHSFYPGMIVLEGNCTENLIGANHLRRERETYAPFQSSDNGLDDYYGLIFMQGSDNTVTGNHLTFAVAAGDLKPAGAVPTMMLVKSGTDNYLAANHTSAKVPVHTVVLDGSTINTRVMDCGSQAEVFAFDSAPYGFRETPLPS